MALLEIRDLRVEYQGRRGPFRAVDGLTLSIRAGETYTLVGESGCGKTATALAVMRLVEPGRISSLAQTLLKLTAPGAPDFYQGTDIWDLSLVDPDNRRPVDYELRRRLLSELNKGMGPEEILAQLAERLDNPPEDERARALAEIETIALLRLRQRLPSLPDVFSATA